MVIRFQKAATFPTFLTAERPTQVPVFSRAKC